MAAKEFQWKENSCGSWGSSEQARLQLMKGVKAPDCGHPRYNKLWFTIGPQFSADVYGLLTPGMPNAAASMAAPTVPETVTPEPIFSP